jgi:hypothetical protein
MAHLNSSGILADERIARLVLVEIYPLMKLRAYTNSFIKCELFSIEGDVSGIFSDLSKISKFVN